MSYKEAVELYKDTDLNKIGIVYAVSIDDLEPEVASDLMDEFFYDSNDEYIWLTEADIERNDIPSGAVDWCSGLLRQDFMMEDIMSELVKPADHYLVVLHNARWNGASGCAIVDSVEESLYRDYDCMIYPREVSPGGKVLTLTEYHHDCPMGHSSQIIALTEREYERYCDMDINDILSNVMKKGA